MSTQVFAKGIVQRPDDRVLVLKRSDTDDRRPSEWDFPGGTVEAGEGPDEGAAREVMEEAGLLVDPKTLRLVYAATAYYEPSSDSNTRVLFAIRINETGPSVLLSHEHSQFKWQTPQQALAEHPHPVYRAGLAYALDHDLLPKQQ